jgi:uncharacterized membrane protein YkvA (DUF1232 family)
VANWSLLTFGLKHGNEVRRTLRILRALSWEQRASLLSGLARDPRLPKRVKLATLLVAAYVASPVDLVPDFIPVIGRVDDLIVMRFALRYISRSLPEGLFQEHVQRVTALSPEGSDQPAG